MTRWRAPVAEAIGTGLLLFVIVGSGVAAERLSADGAVQLLAHALVVGLGLGVLVLLFQTVSGSHFNPSVTLVFWRTGGVSGPEAIRFVGAQLLGAMVGVIAANLTFNLAAATISTQERAGLDLILAEAVATFVLVLVILALVRTGRASAVPAAVGAWVAVIVFATSSTGFANPAVTIGRVFTDSYTGIAPASVIGFVVVQLLAGVAAAPVARVFYPDPIPAASPK